ncbi:hypothetical protein STSP2_00417 [Anaerohalosphaera lusitana]|uniref:PKD domain-containing protein n=1 Tax=Anaerohalosphaera lusitana TaxID=1936003 RepID=A0A1U9NHP7_9BACT|nr:PKD domain-containing protein [Anaerohalosphaera lusitana]AQT67274.1 hypothetical protein STSP2_00417 [Anaerohalosphaera lusitana]
MKAVNGGVKWQLVCFGVLAAICLAGGNAQAYVDATFDQPGTYTLSGDYENVYVGADGNTYTTTVVMEAGVHVNNMVSVASTGALEVYGGSCGLGVSVAAGGSMVVYGENYAVDGTPVAEGITEVSLGFNTLSWTDAAGTSHSLFIGSDEMVQLPGLAVEENQAPAADAGGPYVVDATSWDGAEVTLNGSASSDPDGDDIVSYEWDIDGDGAADSTQASFVGLFPIGASDITLVVVDSKGLASEPVTTTVTVSTWEVGVDIKPESTDNTINMGSNGVVPVAFLSSSDFDATTIDPLTVTLRGEDFNTGLVKVRGKKQNPMATETDVNGDGLIDLYVKLETEKLAEYELDAVCDFGALTYDGLVVSGSDSITVVPQ